MSLNCACLLPHSPLLIPEIGHANYNFFAKTIVAYEKIGQKIKAENIDTLIIISTHAALSKNYFYLNVAPEMEINLKEFGFIPPRTSLNGDAVLADKINSALKEEFPLLLISEAIIDYGSAIPSYILKKMALNPKIIIIAPAEDLPLDKQYSFGVALGKIINNSEKRIAVIASGDLSHRLKKKSPGGYSPKGAKFDNKLIENLSNSPKAAENIIKMEEKLITAAGECALKPTLILLGALDKINFETEVMVYQTEFGVGYLSLDFVIKKIKERKTGESDIQ